MEQRVTAVRHSRRTTERLSAFSDGVFAVLITVLVLDLRPPELPTFKSLLSLWPTWLSYAVSYLFIALVWTNHHHLMRYATEATAHLMWFNFAHLFSVSLLPLSTAWMAVSELAPQDGDLDSVFATLVRLRAGGLVIAPDQFLYARSGQIALHAVRHALPTIFQYREYAAAGGLMSYGGNAVDAFRLVGVYTGRILKGEKPSDLPVHQSTKVELVINMKTAKALGITLPLPLLGRADELIE